MNCRTARGYVERGADRKLAIEKGITQLDSREIFVALYRRASPAIGRFLARRNGSIGPEHVEDMVQEVFARAWKNRGAFEGRASPETYLKAIAKYVLLQEYDRLQRQRRKYLPERAESDPPEIELERQELRAQVKSCMQRLSTRQREALYLVYFQRLRPKEAAARSGCTIKAMRRRLQAAVATLRVQLSPS